MKVLLIDDHPLILAALGTVIEGLGEGVSVVGADSARAARSALQSQGDFDLVLLDLLLADADGFDLLAELRSDFPGVPVVVVSASDRSGDVIRAIDLGAMGFVSKRSSNDVLFQALRQVLSGGIFVPPMTVGRETAKGREAGQASLAAPLPAPLRTQAPVEMPSPPLAGAAPEDGSPRRAPSLSSLGLTPRQTDVLSLLLQAKPNKLIARDLNLSVETVKDHVAAVLRSLGVATRTQAVLAVSQMSQQYGAFQAWKPTPKR